MSYRETPSDGKQANWEQEELLDLNKNGRKNSKISNTAIRQNESNGCGLGRFRPQCIQKFADYKYFMIVYGLLGTVQAMTYVYFILTLTTLERRFGIPSKTTGMMLSGNEVSQILLSLILSYAGGQRNRPVWIAWGVAFSAVSCYVLALPHFIYGPGEQALTLTKEYGAQQPLNTSSFISKETKGLCGYTSTQDEDCESGDYSKVPPILVFVSQFILGIGTTLYYALGQTYVDDNTKKTNTPMILGLTLALRTVGPSLGFVIGFLCLNVYIDPSLTPIIDRKDPRWFGAWWLGWLILGTVMILFAFLIAMFPKQLPPRKIKKGPKAINERNIGMNNGQKVPDKGPPTLKEFPVAFKRLLNNKLLVINIFSGVFYILGASGYMTYLNKYIEVQFEKNAANATIVLGPMVMFSLVLGFLISGYVISKFKPSPKYLLSWNVVVGVVVVLGEISLIFISCDNTNLVGYDVGKRTVNVVNECNTKCGCEKLKYSPVCLEESQLTFYSACHAGCTSVNKSDKTQDYYHCDCIPQEAKMPFGQSMNGTYFYTSKDKLNGGACPAPCGHNFKLFIAILCIIQFLGSSGKIGNILVNYRAVLPEDKAFAQGFALLLVSSLAFIPGPILFGFIIDATCVIWDTNCGENGSCWIYDKHAFRINVGTTAVALTSIGVFLDLLVCFLGKKLKLYNEDEESSPNDNQNVKTSSM